MNRYTLSLLFLFFSFLSFAQNEIKGRVFYALNGKPVVGSMVTMHPTGSTSILTYAITNNEGIFILKHKELPDSVTIRVSAMTVEQQVKTVRSDIEFIEFPVKENKMKLKEVIVKAPKIRQLGDTLNYSVLSFTNATDRSIGDVLKKLPGIQVLPSGQILYQNKEINKFYIEGLDLLKGKYGLATQNVDASKVATVQVLENHQPIKALQGIEIPENAAINLKLKSSAVGAFFATAQLGAGLPSVLLSNELLGMRFARSQQNMLVYKGDNTGRDISRELKSHYNLLRNSSIDFLSVVIPSPPAINEQHHLFNDAHIVALNDLRSLKKDMTISSNINFLYDKQKSSGYSKREIFLIQSDTVLIEEVMDAKRLKRELGGSLVLEKNTDNYYLNNQLRVEKKWNGRQSDIRNNETILQKLNLPSFYIGNEFEYLKRKNDNQQRIRAHATYSSQRNSLRVSPVLFEDFSKPDSSILQKVTFNHLDAQAILSRNKKVKRIDIGYSTGVSLNHYTMESGLLLGNKPEPVLIDSFQNNIGRTETKIIFSPSLTYRAPSGLLVAISLPLNYLFLHRQDRIRDSKQNNNLLLFSPNLNLQHSLSSRIKFHSRLSFSKGIDPINEDYLGYIMTNYRSMNRSDGLLSEQKRTSGYLSFNYKNPFTTLFTSIHLSYNNTWRNMLYNVNYKGVLSSRSGILHPNTSHNYSISYSIEKSIAPINSEVKVYVSYSKSLAVAMNEQTLSDYTSDTYSISPNITTNLSRNITLIYGASYRWSRSKIRKSKMDPVNYFRQNISMSLTPTKGLTLSVSLNHYYNDMIKSSVRSSWFGNAGILYKIKKIDLMLDWTNIFNSTQFTSYSYSDISNHYSIYELRPSEILLRVRFKVL